MVIDRTSARALAERWVAAWNSGDLEQVFALYHDAIHYRSVGRKVVVEILELDGHRRVIRGCACHGADA